MSLAPSFGAESICHRVLETPDLLNIICDSVSTSDCARLSRTCKAVFKPSAAYLWRNLNGAQHLLYLLGETSMVEVDEYGRNQTVFKIEESADVNFTRFDIYAPFVCTLNVYGSESHGQYYRFDGWEHLISRSQYQALLPNLSCLILESVAQRDYPLWIQSLATPSITSIRQGCTKDVFEPPSIRFPTADIVMDTIAKRCPGLLHLSIYPSIMMSPSHSKQADDLLGPLWARPCHQSLGSMMNLVELACSTVMLRPESLLAISLMPCLRLLRINGSCDPADLDPGICSPGSFPALRELRIFGLDSPTIILLLGIRSLAEKLTYLKLDYRPEEFEPEGIEDRAEFIASEVLSPLKNASRLLSLDLVIDLNGVIEEPYDIGNQDLLRTLSKLELETISIQGAHVGSWTRNPGTLKEIWSNMTSVSIWDQITTLDNLLCFAQLPRLQNLLLNVCFEPVGPIPKALSHCPLRILECSGRNPEQYASTEIAQISKYLLALFPNLHEAKRAHRQSGFESEPQTFFMLLNQRIEHTHLTNVIFSQRQMINALEQRLL